MRRVLFLLVLACHTPVRADDALAPGTVLDASTASAADGLLPPDVVGRYKAGEFKNTMGAWPKAAPWEDAFAAASRQNAERYDVNDRGTIVDKATGKPAAGIYGIPFAIDPQDPKAGVKVMWNAYYALWRIGST